MVNVALRVNIKGTTSDTEKNVMLIQESGDETTQNILRLITKSTRMSNNFILRNTGQNTEKRQEKLDAQLTATNNSCLENAINIGNLGETHSRHTARHDENYDKPIQTKYDSKSIIQ